MIECVDEGQAKSNRVNNEEGRLTKIYRAVYRQHGEKGYNN